MWFGCAGRGVGVAGWVTAFCKEGTAGFLGRRVPPQVGLPPNLVLQQQQTNFAQPALEIEEGNGDGAILKARMTISLPTLIFLPDDVDDEGGSDICCGPNSPSPLAQG